MNALDASGLDAIVRVIQSSLAPVFLLTAVASLLGVLTTRLARISDLVAALSHTAPTDATTDRYVRRRLAQLRRRSHILDVAVVLGALAGACTCATVLTLFLGLLRAKATVTLLFFMFGLAILCTMGALTAFMTEVLVASRGTRADVDRRVEQAVD